MTLQKIFTIHFVRCLFNSESTKYHIYLWVFMSNLPQITIMGENNYQCTKQSPLGRNLSKETWALASGNNKLSSKCQGNNISSGV